MNPEGQARPETDAELIERLKIFYSVDTLEQLVLTQDKQIERLQERLQTGLPSFSAVNRLREG